MGGFPTTHHPDKPPKPLYFFSLSEKARKKTLSGVAEDEVDLGLAGGDVEAQAVGELLGEVEGVVDGQAAVTLENGRADGAVAGLHALNGEAGGLGLDGRDVGARPAVVAVVGHVELEPGGGVAALRVDGDRVARRRGADALRVLVHGHVLRRARRQRELHRRVAVVPPVDEPVGPDLVRAHHLPRLRVLPRDLDRVVVLVRDVLGHQQLVAAPLRPDVADVGDLRRGRALVVRLAERRVRGHDVGVVGRAAAGRGSGGVGRGGGGGLSLRRGGGSRGSGDLDLGGGGSHRGRNLGGRRGSSSSSVAAVSSSVVGVGPADLDTVDDGVDEIADGALLVEVGVAVVLVGGTTGGVAGAHGGEQENGVLDMHF